LTSAQRNFADSYVPVFSNPFKTPLSNKDPWQVAAWKLPV
jgi:hypothetical protein